MFCHYLPPFHIQYNRFHNSGQAAVVEAAACAAVHSASSLTHRPAAITRIAQEEAKRQLQATCKRGAAVSADALRNASESSEHSTQVAQAAAAVAMRQHRSAEQSAREQYVTMATCAALHGRAIAAEHARDVAHSALLEAELSHHAANLALRAELFAAQEQFFDRPTFDLSRSQCYAAPPMNTYN